MKHSVWAKRFILSGTMHSLCPMRLDGALSLSLFPPIRLLGFILALVFAWSCHGEDATSRLEDKTLRVGVVRGFAPYQYEENGKPTGFDVELARAAASTIGYAIVFEMGTKDAILNDVVNGRLDAMVGITNISSQESLFKVSVPTCVVTYSAFVQEGSALSSLADLHQKTVAIPRGSEMINYLLGHPLASNVVYADDEADALNKVALRLVDAAILPKMVGLYYVDEFKLSGLYPIPEEVYAGPHGFAVLTANLPLLLQFNGGLAILDSNGQYDIIFRRWFGSDAPRIPRRVIEGFLIGAGVLILLFMTSLLLLHFLRKHIQMRTAELARSESQYRLLTDNVPDMISRHTPSGRILYVSPTSRTLLGYNPEELLGLYPQNFIHPDDLPTVAESLATILHTPSISLNTCRAKHADGTYIWVEITNRSLAATQGGPITEILSVTRDVNERVVAEEALQREREFARLVLDNVTDGVVACDEHGKLLFLNNAARRWHGEQAVNLPPERWAEYYHLFGADGVTPLSPDGIPLRRAFLGEEVHGEAMSIVAKGQEPRYVLASAAPLYDDQGRKLGAVVALHDVTLQRHAELVLRESEEKYRLLFNAMIEGVSLHELVCDADGVPVDYYIVRTNPAYEKQTGLSVPQNCRILASELFQVVPPPFLETYAEVALTGKSCSFERYFAPLNRYFEISVFSPSRGQFATVFEDISERKLAEEKVRVLNVELEERVRERTAALEMTNRELEAFAYSVSHDLSAPLRCIDGFSLALIEEWGHRMDEKNRHYLERVRSNAQRMRLLIDDLLRLSKITQADMIRERVDLTRLADRVLGELKYRDEDRRIDWVLEQNIVVWGDGRLLEIALGNLLSNAWKFTANEPVRRIELGTTLQDGCNVYYVRDNGAGFDMTYSGKLFGTFQRLHRQEEFEGTGIGLATVKRIIHRHGGRIWAEAAVGQGATFYFTLGENPDAVEMKSQE